MSASGPPGPHPREAATAASPDHPLGRARLAWVGFGGLLLALLIYFPALGFYYVGDDITFIRPDPGWLSEALNPHRTWHFYPITQILLYGLTALTGWRPVFLHALNLLIHAGIAFGLCLWLRRLGMDARVCVIAPLWFIGRGISHEVVTWITELSYLLSVVFSLLTLAWWDRWLSGAENRWRAATVAGFAAALLTIEHSLVLVPLYLLWDILMGRERSLSIRRADPGGAGRALVRVAGQAIGRYLPFALVVIGFLAVKQLQSRGLLLSSLPTAAPPPVPSGMDVMVMLPAERTWLGIFNTPLRAYLDLLLGATYLFLPTALASGAEDTWLTRHPGWVFLPWLAIHLWAIVKGRPLTRFLLAWVYIYLLPLALAGIPQARYYYMASVPASVLVAQAVVAAWRWLEGRMPARLLGPAIAATLAVVIVGEAIFVRQRLVEWKQASDLMRSAVRSLAQDLDGDVRTVYWVNLPRIVPGPSWPAWAFGNTGEHLPSMLRPPRFDVKSIPVYDRSFVDRRWPTVGSHLSREELRARLAEPGTIGYEFEAPPPRIERLR